jgi:hypothetical protein
MADRVGEQDIRGIDHTKFVTGFADEDSLLKGLVPVVSTSNREIRWFQKTAGFLDTQDTQDSSVSRIFNVPERALPEVVGPTWTKKTSYVKKFMVESETISEEDLNDNDVQAMATTLRDLIRAVANQVDIRIYSTLIEASAATPTTPNPTDTLTTAAVADGWDDAATGNPIKDILTGNRKIRAQSYNTNNIVLYINPIEHENLLNYLIDVKGSSIPSFSSQKVVTGQIQEILGNRVIVSQNATTDNALQFTEGRSAEWRSFTPMESHVIDNPGVGKKVRVLERGEGLLTNPKSVHQITDTVV